MTPDLSFEVNDEATSWEDATVERFTIYGAEFAVDVKDIPDVMPQHSSVLMLGSIGLTIAETASVLQLTEEEVANTRSDFRDSFITFTDHKEGFGSVVQWCVSLGRLSLVSRPAGIGPSCDPCEQEVIRDVSMGHNTAEIAERLRRQHQTFLPARDEDAMQHYITSLRTKYGVRNRSALVLFGHATGVLGSRAGKSR